MLLEVVFLQDCKITSLPLQFCTAEYLFFFFNPLIANFTKWSNTLKQFVGKLPTNCLSVYAHFVGLALKGLTYAASMFQYISILWNKRISDQTFQATW